MRGKASIRKKKKRIAIKGLNKKDIIISSIIIITMRIAGLFIKNIILFDLFLVIPDIKADIKGGIIHIRGSINIADINDKKDREKH